MVTLWLDELRDQLLLLLAEQCNGLDARVLMCTKGLLCDLIDSEFGSLAPPLMLPLTPAHRVVELRSLSGAVLELVSHNC